MLGAGGGPAGAQDLFGTAFVPRTAGVAGTGGPSTLYAIDPTTGVSTAIGSGIGFDKVGAIDFDPISGQLFGIGDPAGVPGTPQLITINPTTGLGTAVGRLTGTTTTRNAYNDLSFRADGTLYLFQANPEQLFTVDTATGAATALPNASPFLGGGNAIAFDPLGTLFGGEGNFAATLDPSTGVETQGSAWSSDTCNYLAAADFPASGDAFGALQCGGQGSDSQLATVDFANATITEVGPFTDSATQLQIVGLDGIAVQEPVSPD